MAQKMIDGTDLYRQSITTIHQLRERMAVLERAFRAYVTDSLEANRQGDKPDPPILGFCLSCGFPVYDSDIGSGGRFHYVRRGYQSAPILCDTPLLDS